MSSQDCSVESCGDDHYGRGFCRKHYKADHYQRNKAKRRQQNIAWRDANQERQRELNRLRYERDGEQIRERSAAYRKANPERARAVVQEWAKANAERKRELDRAYRQANAERLRERAAEYHRANRHITREAYHRRKALKLGLRVTRTDLEAILVEHGMVCHICGGEIADRSDLHFDHVHPLSRGGSHTPDNIRPAHARCNLQKGPRLLAS